MKNRPAIYLITLYFLQILLSLIGTQILQIRANPFFLLAVSVALPVYYIRILSDSNAEAPRKPLSEKAWLFTLLAILPTLLAYEELRKIWVKWAEPGKVSDVIPQLQAQNDWFFSGQFPYQWVLFESYRSYPVYMPLHWMPVELARLFHIDVRWAGCLVMLAAMGIASYLIARKVSVSSINRSYLALVLWSIPIWSFIVFNPMEIAVSLETIVAAWYLLLVAGLIVKNHWLIGIGLAGCLLSRYTGVFWVPTFAFLLWRYQPKKYSYYIWGGVAAAILGFYVIPFWLKDPTILKQGVLYHNMCALAGWAKPDQYTYEHGLNLAIHLREWLPGTPEESLFLSRALQGAVMLLLSIASIWLYVKKWHKKTDIYTFSLASLQLVLVLFYLFSPMVFQYYMLVPLMTAGVMCWQAISAPGGRKAV